MNNKTNIEEDIKKITDMINYISSDSEPIYTREEWFVAIKNIRIVMAGLQTKANKYDSLVEKIKETQVQSEKENASYEKYNKESRMYWINEGKKSLCSMLLDRE